MRSKEGLLFLIMALLCFCIHPSASSLAEVLPLVHSQENMKDKAAGEHFINNNYHQGSGIAIAHQNKFGHGINGGGTNGGQPAVSGGGSHSPYMQGGGGVTPLYAAGAGNNHQYHHSGGNSDKSRTGPATLAITTFASFLLCIHKDCKTSIKESQKCTHARVQRNNRKTYGLNDRSVE
ncbi:hypothetical protein Pfo_015495 [Paulownia fortunei]|nr:hypothetical protein Pfo_015495 [Paulownia fortunei]